MQFASTFASLLAFSLAAAVQAAPFNGTESLVPRATGHIYVCTGTDFTGTCDNYGITIGACSNFPSYLYNDILSVGPDQGLSCWVYLVTDCGLGDKLSVGYPGYSSLWDVLGGHYANQIKSVECSYD